ncbi:rRNA processing protein, partial [Dispira parvispora]
MTRSTRKKKQQKQDFQKVKLKIGKKKALAANHTDTSFSARAIVLAAQNLRLDRDNEITSS